MSGVTTETAKNLILDAGAVYVDYGEVGERLLGATAGGNTFTVEREIREIEVDGVKGKVKGLRRIISENATLKVRLKEMSTNNLIAALGGTESAAPTMRTVVQAEYLGVGTAGVDSFTANNAPIVGTEKFYVDGVAVSWTLGVDYSIVGTTVATLAAATLALGEELTMGYAYASGGLATYDSITSTGAIALADYLTNVALVATVSGSASVPVVILLKNALGDGNLEMALSDKDEAVPELTFSAHYDPAALTTPIYEIRYPLVA